MTGAAMPSLAEPAALGQWHVIDNIEAVGAETKSTRLLGVDLSLRRGEAGEVVVTAALRPAS